MEMKHTPGPYTRESEYVSAERNRTTGREVIRNAAGEFLCYVDQSHAPLFAAAPELLAALKGAEEWLEGFASAEPYITVIRDAIDKATGFAAWRAAADTYAEAKYAIEAAEVCGGDLDRLRLDFAHGSDPKECVDAWAENYDLTPIDDWNHQQAKAAMRRFGDKGGRS